MEKTNAILSSVGREGSRELSCAWEGTVDGVTHFPPSPAVNSLTVWLVIIRVARHLSPTQGPRNAWINPVKISGTGKRKCSKTLKCEVIYIDLLFLLCVCLDVLCKKTHHHATWRPWRYHVGGAGKLSQRKKMFSESGSLKLFFFLHKELVRFTLFV